MGADRAGEAAMLYHWLGIDAEDYMSPECDGDFENMECVESDGWITCWFSGSIKPL